MSNVYIHPTALDSANNYDGYLPVLTECKKHVVLMHEDEIKALYAGISSQSDLEDSF